MSADSEPFNQAAYIVGRNVKPLQVRRAPYTKPGSGEIVIRTRAVAINPVDHIIQNSNLIYGHLKYPTVLGFDVSGEVVEVGKNVTRFQKGDRVVGSAAATVEKINSAAHGGFQRYTVLLAHMASPIPDDLSFEEASVIPLGLDTAASGLFQKDQLGLEYPTVPAAKPPTGKTVLVWGGSTSVGCNAIQIAVAAGYEVVTTCSPRNFALVKSLGASQAFDYNSGTVVKDIKRAFMGRTVAGAMSIGHGAAHKCLDILATCRGAKALTMISYPMPKSPPKRFVLIRTVFTYLTGMISIWIKAKRHGIRTGIVDGYNIINNEVGPMIYQEYLPDALAERAFVPAPKAEIVGHGLENAQRAMDLLQEGVSAKKLVITL